MIDFDKNPWLAVIVYVILLISCVIEITDDLGFHEFDAFGSHHGLAVFALGSLLSNYNKLSTYTKKFLSSKQNK